MRRSIPACAGEPRSPFRAECRPRVYPRVCGGTAFVSIRADFGQGLSPRVRGNRWWDRDLPPRPGSIPACAGEPQPRIARTHRAEVYPRVCGGTVRWTSGGPIRTGLSPRVRGNRGQHMGQGHRVRSIPACAGEPPSRAFPKPQSPVYPRVCGGTVESQCGQMATPGLSPRVRGNRPVRRPAAARPGSIPACAGEPVAEGDSTLAREVYPRVCGGTAAPTGNAAAGPGLSPRVRGNRRPALPPGCSSRSIPACAGEPRRYGAVPGVARVYPRVCGGTCGIPLTYAYGYGLSPRVRGNRGKASNPYVKLRSIPACAGEPRLCRPAFVQPPVYPRVCGGTGMSE